MTLLTCELCGKLISRGWFGFVDTRLKCGACSKPPRAEVGRFIEVNHDPGDEHQERA